MSRSGMSARAILWALAITVIMELLPVTAVLMGAPDLKALLGAENVFGEFITARGGAAINTGDQPGSGAGDLQCHHRGSVSWRRV